MTEDRLFMWNISDLADERTNNRLEGYNFRLSIKLRGGHSNFWLFLNLLKKELIAQKIEFAQFTGGAVFRRRSSKLERREHEISRLKELYVSDEISAADFVEEMIKLL